MTVCHYCVRTITEVYGIPIEIDGVLDEMLVGRECLKRAAADGYDNPQRLTFGELIERTVAKVDFGKATARKAGRNPKWPYVPIIDHSERDGRQSTEQIRARAFAEREDAVRFAADVIAGRRNMLAEQLGERRYRALREQHGLPREIPDGEEANARTDL